jgi:hypothetical protein
MNTQNTQGDCAMQKIYTINDYLFTFRKLIKNINGDNLVIAGVNALKIHGLKMSRQANDLDIVLFCPTEKQLTLLRGMASLSICEKQYEDDKDKIQDESYPIDNMVLKFKKDNLYLDIILEKECCPNDLLFHKFNNEYYKIQNIALNIKAKNSYAVRNQDGLRLYRRIKYSVDFQDLKNSNFNIE